MRRCVQIQVSSEAARNDNITRVAAIYTPLATSPEGEARDGDLRHV